jgi:hypothetical protein
MWFIQIGKKVKLGLCYRYAVCIILSLWSTVYLIVEWPPTDDDQENMLADPVTRITDLTSPLYIHQYNDKVQ